MKVTTDRTQPKVIVSEAAFPWSITPCKKTKIAIDSFQRYWWSNTPAIWLDKRRNWSYPTNRGSSRCHIHLMAISMQKNLWGCRISSRMIKESYNLIGWEARLTRLNWYSPMLPFLDDYHHAKNLIHRFIPSWDIDNPRTLQLKGWYHFRSYLISQIFSRHAVFTES